MAGFETKIGAVLAHALDPEVVAAPALQVDVRVRDAGTVVT